MPGLHGPSDYAREPLRHPSLRINAKEPFNAEPLRADLVSSYVTPVEFFYKRNHGPIPIVEDIGRYSVTVSGLIERSGDLFMGDILKLPKYNVTATLQVFSAVWGGAKLADVLELFGISKFTYTTKSGGKHVEFVSIDKCKSAICSLEGVTTVKPGKVKVRGYASSGGGRGIERVDV